MVTLFLTIAYAFVYYYSWQIAEAMQPKSSHGAADVLFTAFAALGISAMIIVSLVALFLLLMAPVAVIGW